MLGLVAPLRCGVCGVSSSLSCVDVGMVWDEGSKFGGTLELPRDPTKPPDARDRRPPAHSELLQGA